jgi:hypothetical protein
VQEVLAKTKMAAVSQPPYSPDIAPSDFFLFTKKKINLKWRRFDTAEEIQAETQTVLSALTKTLPGYISKVATKLGSVCALPRDYFEGDDAERGNVRFTIFECISGNC